jgi:hypothetical protein
MDKQTSDIATKLRYMGNQYIVGSFARGGEQHTHYLIEAADTIERLQAERDNSNLLLNECRHDKVLIERRLQAEVERLTPVWKSEVPKIAGWYWCRYPSFGIDIHQCKLLGVGDFVAVVSNDYVRLDDDGFRGCQWARAVTPPSEPAK